MKITYEKKDITKIDTALGTLVLEDVALPKFIMDDNAIATLYYKLIDQEVVIEVKASKLSILGE